MTHCPECGASYVDADDNCDARFEALLALDHSHREPWGSRHGLAFATFALQHAQRYASSLDAAWFSVAAVYRGRHDRADVATALRAAQGRELPAWGVASRPDRAAPTTFAVTIRDLEAFEAPLYPSALDRWATATLDAWEQGS